MTVRRHLCHLLAGVALAAGLGGQAAHAEMQARLGHVFAVDSPVDNASKEFAELVAKRTDGEVQITVYPNSQLGGDEALGRDLSRGALEFGFLNSGSLTGLDPLLDIHYLPYIATDFDEVDKIFYSPDGVLQTTLRETLKKHNMETLAFYELEFRAVTNSVRAVETLQDLEGLKLRVPGSAVIRGFFEAAGVQAVTMPFPELFTALQQGTVDGQDNGASITYNSRLHEAQDYMTLTNHVYAMGQVVASDRFWSRLSDAQKETIRTTAKEVTRRQIERNRELNAKFLQEIADSGVEVTRLSDAEMAEFKKVGRQVWAQFEDVYGKQRIEALRAEVKALSDN